MKKKPLKTRLNEQAIKLIEMVPLDLIKSKLTSNERINLEFKKRNLLLIKVENLKGNCTNLVPGTVRYSKKDNLIAIKCKVILILLLF